MASSLAASAKTSISKFKLSFLISQAQSECEAPSGRISGTQMTPCRKTWNLQYIVNSNVFFGPSLEHLCKGPVVLVGIFLFPSDLFSYFQCAETLQDHLGPGVGQTPDRISPTSLNLGEVMYRVRMYKKNKNSGHHGAILPPSSKLVAISPVSMPRISWNSSHRFEATGFKLGQVTLETRAKKTLHLKV